MRPTPSLRRVTALASFAASTLVASAAFAQASPDQPTPPAPSSPTSPAAPAPTPAAQADDGKAMVRLAFSRADANKDGKLSPDEANVLPAVAAKFTQLDTNKDGFISEDEFTTGVRIGN